MPNRRGGLLVEAALVEELARLLRVGRGELVGVVGLGDLVGLEHPRAQVDLPLRGTVVAAFLVAQLDAVLVGEPLDRLGEPDAVDLHQERDDVAALLAPEAVEVAARGVTWKDGDFSSWKGHRPFWEPPPAFLRVT